MLVADFDDDGLDGVAYIMTSIDNLSVMLGNNFGVLNTETAHATADMPRAMVAADVNTDGILDLIVTSGAGQFVSILLSTP